jgi:drug/metabolite transporter (DMT)-like permease
VLASTGPLWIALLAPALLRERLGVATLVGLVLALAGVSVVMGLGVGQPQDLAGGLTGNLIILLSSAAAAVYTVLGKGLAQRYSPLTFCTVSCLGGAVASVPLAIWELAAAGPVTAPTPLGWALLVYLGVLVTCFGFGVWFWGLRALPAARAGALMFLQPLSGCSWPACSSATAHAQLPAGLRASCWRAIYLAVGRPTSP